MKKKKDKKNIINWIIGIVLPVIGLLNYFYLKTSGKLKEAKRMKPSFIIGFLIIPVIFGLICLICFLIDTFGLNDKKIIDPIITNSCNQYCDEKEAKYNEKESSCECTNKEVIYIDELGHKIDKGEDTSDNKMKDVSLKGTTSEVKAWVSDNNSNRYVVTVLALSFCSTSEEYQSVINKLAEKKGFKLYWFEIDKLSKEDYEVVRNSYDLTGYKDTCPFTFITKNKSYLHYYELYETEDKIKDFLRKSNVI